VNRLLVTNHDALGYFADRYDFEIVGVVIPGGSTLADPSSAELAALVETLLETDVPAIFAETSSPAQLAETVAAEAGNDVEVVELHTGSLGEPGSGADTLIGMLRTNATRIRDALT
jgi:zinc/manganese transport system substrate-binding protein